MNIEKISSFNNGFNPVALKNIVNGFEATVLLSDNALVVDAKELSVFGFEGKINAFIIIQSGSVEWWWPYTSGDKLDNQLQEFGFVSIQAIFKQEELPHILRQLGTHNCAISEA